MILYDRESEGKDVPMVSGPVNQLEVRVDTKASREGARGMVKALIDSGCSCYLISQAVVQRLGLHVRKLKKPVKFEQVDGMLIGGKAASHLMKPLQLGLRNHQKTICFMVAPKMAEDMFLGLAWLMKWGVPDLLEENFKVNDYEEASLEAP